MTFAWTNVGCNRMFVFCFHVLNDVRVPANGRGRTDDLRITNALLYQLSYVGRKIIK